MYMTEDASGYWIGAFELMNKHQDIQIIFPVAMCRDWIIRPAYLWDNKIRWFSSCRRRHIGTGE